MKYKKSKYVFPVERNLPSGARVCLLFSGRTGKNIFVSNDTFHKVVNDQFEYLPTTIRETLILNKVIVPASEDELQEINKENKMAMTEDKKDRLYISIQPTASCQLACDYCGQRHSKKFLDNQHIEAIIERVEHKLNQAKFKTLEIGWFGGGPLCALKNMSILNSRLKTLAKAHEVQYLGHITTNGYALSPTLYKDLKDSFNIRRIEITLDGSKEYHDKRRFTCNGKGSFDMIFKNLVNIVSSEHYDFSQCPISVRCNVDERNVEGVFPLLKLFVEKELQRKILFYTTAVVSWSNNGAGSEEGRMLLGEYSTNHIAYMIENDFIVGILPHRAAPYKCLGTDEYAEMYDADGNIFDCSETSYSDYYNEKGFTLGNVLESTSNTNMRSCLKDVPKRLLNSEISPCNECKFYPLCGGLCPLALVDGTPRCPSFVYNMEDRIFLDFIAKKRV